MQFLLLYTTEQDQLATTTQNQQNLQVLCICCSLLDASLTNTLCFREKKHCSYFNYSFVDPEPSLIIFGTISKQ